MPVKFPLICIYLMLLFSLSLSLYKVCLKSNVWNLNKFFVTPILLLFKQTLYLYFISVYHYFYTPLQITSLSDSFLFPFYVWITSYLVIFFSNAQLLLVLFPLSLSLYHLDWIIDWTHNYTTKIMNQHFNFLQFWSYKLAPLKLMFLLPACCCLPDTALLSSLSHWADSW